MNDSKSKRTERAPEWVCCLPPSVCHLSLECRSERPLSRDVCSAHRKQPNCHITELLCVPLQLCFQPIPHVPPGDHTGQCRHCRLLMRTQAYCALYILTPSRHFALVSHAAAQVQVQARSLPSSEPAPHPLSWHTAHVSVKFTPQCPHLPSLSSVLVQSHFGGAIVSPSYCRPTP